VLRKKWAAMSKCTSSAGRFDGHGGALEQYRWHRPMQHVQGYSRSHWAPPSGNYSLCIAPTAARATGKQTTINKYTYKAGRFDWLRRCAGTILHVLPNGGGPGFR
jgi:hypothetical protein